MRNLGKEVPKAFHSWDKGQARRKKGRVGDQVGEAEEIYGRKERESNGKQTRGCSEAARYTNQKKG